jgi:hypothetical protein
MGGCTAQYFVRSLGHRASRATEFFGKMGCQCVGKGGWVCEAARRARMVHAEAQRRRVGGHVPRPLLLHALAQPARLRPDPLASEFPLELGRSRRWSGLHADAPDVPCLARKRPPAGSARPAPPSLLARYCRRRICNNCQQRSPELHIFLLLFLAPVSPL